MFLHERPCCHGDSRNQSLAVEVGIAKIKLLFLIGVGCKLVLLKGRATRVGLTHLSRVTFCRYSWAVREPLYPAKGIEVYWHGHVKIFTHQYASHWNVTMLRNSHHDLNLIKEPEDTFAARTTAKASYSNESSDSPLLYRSLNSSVFAFSSSSDVQPFGSHS